MNININKYFNDIEETDVINTDEKKCLNCNSVNLLEDFSEGNIVCINCGQVSDNVILDHRQEWTNHDDTNVSRCGMTINKLLPHTSMGTTIVGYGNTNLKKLQNWIAVPYKEKSLSYVLKYIQDKCSKNKILRCIEDDAKIMFKMISECKHIKGKNKDKFVITRKFNRISIIAACVFYACMRKNMSRTPKEIASIFNITPVKMNKGCKNFKKLMNTQTFDMTMQICTAEQFILRHCSTLNMKEEHISIAQQIARNVNRIKIASIHTPHSVAAASILLMANLNDIKNINRKQIAEQFGISEVTIIKSYKKIEQYKNVLCDENVVKILENNVTNEINNIDIPANILNLMMDFGIIINVKEILKQNNFISMFKNKNNDLYKCYEDYIENIISHITDNNMLFKKYCFDL